MARDLQGLLSKGGPVERSAATGDLLLGIYLNKPRHTWESEKDGNQKGAFSRWTDRCHGPLYYLLPGERDKGRNHLDLEDQLGLTGSISSVCCPW